MRSVIFFFHAKYTSLLVYKSELFSTIIIIFDTAHYIGHPSHKKSRQTPLSSHLHLASTICIAGGLLLHIPHLSAYLHVIITITQLHYNASIFYTKRSISPSRAEVEKEAPPPSLHGTMTDQDESSSFSPRHEQSRYS